MASHGSSASPISPVHTLDKLTLRVAPGTEYLHTTYAKAMNDRTRVQMIENAGFDLPLPEDFTIPSRTWGVPIDLQVKCEMVGFRVVSAGKEGHFQNITCNVSFDLRARSSISRTPLILANSVGTIDAGYRGSLKAVVHNFSDETVVLKQGERYFQIVAPALSPFDVSLAFDLSSSERGEGGFGSTGK